jgi:CHAT domain-containing protein
MHRFYENMIVRNMPKNKALREAKLYLRNLRDRSGERPFSHPSDWAAFILIGDAG